MIGSLRRLSLGACGMLLLVSVTLAAPSRPVLFSTGLPGVGTEGPFTLLVALPLNNIGTQAAENLTVTAASLTNATLLGPALPISLGTVASQKSALLNVQFDRSALVDRLTYRLNVSGTYELGGTKYGFAVSRNITLPPPASGSATVGTAMVQSASVNQGNFPPQLPQIDVDVNQQAPPIPTGTFVAGTPTPNGTAAMPQPMLIPRAAVAAAGSVVFNTIAGLGSNAKSAGVGCSGDANAVCSEPSGAIGGGVILVSANWILAYSTDGGNNFTVLDPTTI